MFDSKLLSEICNSLAVFWGGQHPPVGYFTCSTNLFESERDFRQSSIQHGSFDTVYLTEIDIGLYKQWPLILDEALRLLRYKATTSFFVRFKQSSLISVFEFSAFLRRKSKFKFEVIYQETDSDGTIVYALKCYRDSQHPSLSTFEFALITDGKRPAQIQQFIESVTKIRGIENIAWSIAVCGPPGFEAQITNRTGNTRYINEPEANTAKGWITRKKNLLVESSSAENILIAHDRYVLPVDFLDSMFEYGADFSVIVPSQSTKEGERFPDWVSIGSQWAWAPCGKLPYGEYDPNVYVNGGIIISKREVLIETPWNDLLFWNQGEDVELSRSMTENGVTPRLARQIRLLVTDARPGYLYDFASLPSLPNTYALPHGSQNQNYVTIGKLLPGAEISLINTTPAYLAENGITVDPSQLEYTSDGLLPKKQYIEIAASIDPKSTKNLYISILAIGNFKNSELIVRANGELLSIDCEAFGDNSTRLIANLGTAVSDTSRNLVVSINTSENFVLTGFGILFDQSQLDYPIKLTSNNPHSSAVLGSGWSTLESWGVWSDGEVSNLFLPPLDVKFPNDLVIVLKAKAYAPEVVKTQLVSIMCNGVPITLLRINKNKRPRTYKIIIPGTLVRDSKKINLQLRALHLSSPAEQGLSTDSRKLGVGLVSVNARKVQTR